jgi:hypothetical protein
MMTRVGRSFTIAAAVMTMFAFVAPAFADSDPTGTYRIVTGTGKHMIVTIIGTTGGIDGMYAGNGVGGRIHGTYNNADPNMVNYTWVEDQNDSTNGTTRRGWGNIEFNDDATRLQAHWGYENSGTAVGLWNAVRIQP